MKLVPLGTNGFFPSLGRQTASFLLLAEDEAILLDAGTGVGRLVEPDMASLLAGQHRLTVFLSHYHIDHVVGLAYLRAVWDGPFTIYGPAPPFTKTGPEEALGRLLNAPYSAPLEAYPAPVMIVPVSDEALTVRGMEFRFRGQRHWRGSMGIRVGDELTYVTDSTVEEGTADLARGTRLLLHEVWLTDEELAADEEGALNHSNVSGVAGVAKEAGVELVWMIHHQPKRSALEIEQMAREIQRQAGIGVVAPAEGKLYETQSAEKPLT